MVALAVYPTRESTNSHVDRGCRLDTTYNEPNALSDPEFTESEVEFDFLPALTRAPKVIKVSMKVGQIKSNFRRILQPRRKCRVFRTKYRS